MKVTSPRLSFVYDRYHKATTKFKSIIELRISYNKKQKYMSTGIKILPKQWKNGVIVNTPDAQQLNQQLDSLLIEVRQVLMDMIKDGNIDIFSIPDKLKKNSSVSFYDFIEQRAKVREYGKSSNTQQKYERFIRFFKEWNGIKSFEDITDINIISYDKFLSAKGLQACSKWSNYHKYLNSFILDAIEAGYIKKNPYRSLNIDKDKHSKGLQRCLTPEEFEKIEKIKLPTKTLEHVRDCFVFQTYTCLSYIDLKDFNPKEIITIKGMKVYTGKRDKTGKEFTIPLLSTPLNILKKYDYKLPVISNVNYNQYLKIVAQAAGIDKPVSTHYARHTGATMLINKDVPIQIISKICGHSSTKITEQIYAKLLDETVVDAIKKLDI